MDRKLSASLCSDPGTKAVDADSSKSKASASGDDGAGAMGLVYLVEDLELNRPAALKTIGTEILDDPQTRADVLARFQQEAKAAANIRHPNIIEIYNAGEHEGHAYFVMEYLPDSCSLRDVVQQATKEGRFVPLADVQQYFQQAAAALRAIHAAGAVHRDIKLDNLLIDATPEGPRLKVHDFGVVHLADSDLTQTGQMIGTPSYLAPEYVAEKYFGAKIETDHRVDLFALGVGLYRCLTNRKPFKGDNYFELYRQLRDYLPSPPSSYRPELPRGWDRVVGRLLEKNPAHRYPDAGALYDDLRHVDGNRSRPLRA